MNALFRCAVTIAAGGMTVTLAETLLPRSSVQKTARIAIGLLFLELLTQQIIGIIL